MTLGKKTSLMKYILQIENVHSERTKFQYDELFKYNVLQECEKKIGVSVKLHDCEVSSKPVLCHDK